MATVTAIGKQSRAGKTVTLVNQASAPGHLQILLGKIIGYLALLDTILAGILVVVAVLRGANLIPMLPFLAMLFIATIPIAMPSSSAVANSVEAKVLGAQHVLVSDLTGIQEAANLNYLFIDKTGTITTNRPTIVQIINYSPQSDAELIRWAVSATDQRHRSVIDQALQNYADRHHLVPYPPQHFVPFNATTGYSQVTITTQHPTTLRLGGLTKLFQLAQNRPAVPPVLRPGRTVALLKDYDLVGIFVLQDQPRHDSAAAIQALRAQGIHVIMLTGDNVTTTQAVAQQVGLPGTVISFTELTQTNVPAKLAGIADVIPENKLAVVQRFQRLGAVVGMTGDGVNDAPALKQAEVGIAVANATDLAKRSAKLVLLTPGLSAISAILASGHRVYQRMMTWTITKLSRTAELTLLLTLGYLGLGFVPLSLNAMILVAILNDVVTLVLGTDHTGPTARPEHWNLGRLSRLAGLLAVSWTVVGLLLMWQLNAHVSAGQLSTALYWYLITSAMVTILMTRTSQLYWRSRPSRPVMLAISSNLILTLVLALSGWGIIAISWQLLLIIGLLVVIISLPLDLAYVMVQRRLT